MSKPEDFKFDSRVRDRLLRSRVLSTAEVQGHLDQLPDLEGQYEVLSDTPQPAVAPARSESHEEPLVFDGIRRLQALSEINSAPPVRYAAPAPSAPSSVLPSYREPESRALGTPFRSNLMESEISGVGAGAVSAALGAMAAEARGAAMFGVPSISHTPTPEAEPPTPVTLRSESSAVAPAAPEEETDEDVDDDDLDDDDADDEDEDDDDADVDDDDDVPEAEAGAETGADDASLAEAGSSERSEPDSEDLA